MAMQKPVRGEVYWVDWEPARGVEQAVRRPALVVQNDRGNRNSRYTVVATISSASLPRVYPFTVALAQGEANLPRPSYVNCAQLMTIDDGRLGTLIGQLPPEVMREVDVALRYELDL